MWHETKYLLHVANRFARLPLLTQQEAIVTISKAAQELGRKGGQAKSPAKTAAARANAKKPRTRKPKAQKKGGNDGLV